MPSLSRFIRFGLQHLKARYNSSTVQETAPNKTEWQNAKSYKTQQQQKAILL